MLERFFEKETAGVLKGITLEWQCPHCTGKNFRILTKSERDSGEYRSRCRYCRARCRVTFLRGCTIEGEEKFMERLADEDFSMEEQQELIREFAEIEYLRNENAKNQNITGKERLLEEKITFFRRRMRR